MQSPYVSTESAFFPVTRELHIVKFSGQFSILISHKFSATVDIYFLEILFSLCYFLPTGWLLCSFLYQYLSNL